MNEIKQMKKWPRILFVGILFLFASSSGFAQGLVKGKVTAGDTGSTLPMVSVSVKGTTRGVTADLDGNYSINILKGDLALVFSFTGYQAKEVIIDGKTEINVVLNVEPALLDEIVVIGYGTIKKSDLTGSVSSVKVDDIKKTTSINPVQALSGKATGVQVSSTSGAPGAGIAVRIRGVGTFNNSAPIYVVDGVILDDISFLNSNDIQSMEVLKDASATAIYGSRGANGVVLIQTKTGQVGQERTIVNFSSEFGMQQINNPIDLLSGREFAIISNEIKPGSFNNVDAVPNTDWQDLVFRNAPMQSHQLSISGAGKKMEYYVGIGLFSQEGTIPKSNYNRLTIKLNNTYHINEFIKFGNNITIAPFKQQNAPNVTYSVYRAQPILKPYYDDGSFGVVYNVGNPLADLEYSNNYANGVRGVGNVFGEATIMKDFKLKSSFGMDASYNKYESFTPAYTVYNPDGTATQQYNEFSDLSKSNSDNFSWLWENTLTYVKSFNKHSINAVVGYTMQQSRSESMGLTGQNVIRDGSDFWYISPSYIIDETNGINTLPDIYNRVDANMYYSMISYLARANYTYDNRYILTATFRRDGSSKFSQENRFSNFPSVAVGWNIGNESFMKEMTAISALKLRGSWGKIGNEKIAYYDRFSRVQSDLWAVFGHPDVAFPGGSYGRAGNPNLRWETTKQTDLGLEVAVLDNKLSAEFDYYNRETDDILVSLATPGHLGNGQGQRVTYNAASVLNRGFEFAFRWRQKVNDFNYSIGILGTTVHNEVLAIGGNSGIDSVLVGGYLANGQAVTLSSIGNPIGAFYGYVTDGIFQNQAELDAYPHTSQAGIGDLRFADINGDNKINGQDRKMIGSPIPKFIFGLNMDMQYKGFDLTVDIQGQTGNKIFNGKDVVRPDPYNFEQHVWDRWTGEGSSSTEPRASFGGYNYTPSDRFVEDGSYLRLRNLILGYTLPQNLTSKIQLEQVRFYLKGSNMFTLTNFSGYSPEVGSYDVLSNGIDTGVYPIPAVYSIGINVTF